ncbi:efflux RND transporter periplasmic adaptor subunit [Marinobacter sp.]|uniref:efflux RND transporter periplasmic adaptor subunit n=1 Tax=Marinobacter sp. TaxID=50741 RepID=UPI002B26AF27|nr:efflux RND transporter periplasmic adaptor subunit [Marinobacter sp.]
MSNRSLVTPPLGSDKPSDSYVDGPVEVAALKREGESLSESGRNSTNTSSLSADMGHRWLAWQCRMISGIIRGALYLPADAQRQGQALSIWPEVGDGESLLIETANQALLKNRGVVRSHQHYGPEKQRACELLACPLLVDQKPVAVVAVMISPRSEAQQRAVLQLLQWGGLWMETLLQQQLAADQQAGAFSLTAMTAILGHSSSHEAAIETVNQLAEHFGCERVSIGFRCGLPIRLQAISHMARFDSRTQLVRKVEAAMEEAVDQRVTMVYPSIKVRDSAVSRAHVELAEHHNAMAICTIPLRGRTHIIGAITLERSGNEPFEKATIALCQSLANLAGPALELKQREERSSLSKGVEALRGMAASVFGTGYLKSKVGVLSALLVLALLSVVEGTYEMTSTARIEGAVRQVLAAPQNGYVKQAEVRAGDLVEAGQLIAVLDDRDLQLQRQKWQSEYNKVRAEYQDALAKRERVELSVLRAQLDQVSAEIRLVEEQLKRTELHAPFDGVVVSGDLSQSLGAPVETGQVLYEIAPLESYRVVLEVDEENAAGLEKGKAGHLVIAAMPGTTFGFVIDQVVPVAISQDNRNFFRVEASLDEPESSLRPGMRGVAKVDMGQHSLLWNWTHSTVNRIRLWLWTAGW